MPTRRRTCGSRWPPSGVSARETPSGMRSSAGSRWRRSTKGSGTRFSATGRTSSRCVKGCTPSEPSKASSRRRERRRRFSCSARPGTEPPDGDVPRRCGTTPRHSAPLRTLGRPLVLTGGTPVPAKRATTVADLDLGVAERQAFGTVYGKPGKHQLLAKLVKAGTLRLPPRPNWTGDVTDWAAEPYGARSLPFRHHTVRWLNRLRWAALEGDEDAAAEWRRVARSGAGANIPAKRAPGLFAWKDMADGNRAIQLSLGAPLIRPEDDWYVPLIEYHVDWLMDEANIVQKNHALHQHTGLVVAAALLRDSSALETAYQQMIEQCVSTFDAQGANDEGATGYHEMNLKWWSQAWERVKAEGLEIPATVEAQLEAGRSALAHLVLPDGTLSQIGDTKRAPVSRGLGPNVDFV